MISKIFIFCLCFICLSICPKNKNDKSVIFLDEIIGWNCENNKLDKVYNIIKMFEGKTVYILCHTDNRGSSEHNKELSKNISESIVKCLKNNYPKIVKKYIAIGCGESQPYMVQYDTIVAGLSLKKGEILDNTFISSIENKNKRESVRLLLNRLEIYSE